MHWSAYEVFSVISGVTLLIMVLLPGVSAKNRLTGLASGIFFIGYGIYVANQTSGTYYFPAAIFVLPFGLAIYYAIEIAGGGKASHSNGPSQSRQRMSEIPAPVRAPETPSAAQAHYEPPTNIEGPPITGDCTCIRLNCPRRGIPTDHERCPGCDFKTQPLSSYRG